MQAFEVEFIGQGLFRFCSIDCAKAHKVNPADGRFVLESAFPVDEKCANCDTILNDAQRARANEVKPADPWLDKLWPVINRRRGELIDKKFLSQLTGEEEQELAMLQEYADLYVAPLDAPKVEALKALVDHLNANRALMAQTETALRECSPAKVEINSWRINGKQPTGFGGSSLPYIEIDVRGSITIHVAGNGRTTSLRDARMVCAAPKLYKALQNFFSWHADHFEDFTHEVNAELLCLANEAEAAICEAEEGDAENEAAALPNRYTVDGTDADGFTLSGTGTNAPFAVFDVEKQSWLAPMYKTRKEAESRAELENK